MIELPGLWSLTPAGFGLGVIAMFYWLLATGRLITLRSHLREISAANQLAESAIARGNEWKEAALEAQRANAVKDKQIGDLIHANKVVESFLRSAGPSFGTGDPNVP